MKHAVPVQGFAGGVCHISRERFLG